MSAQFRNDPLRLLTTLVSRYGERVAIPFFNRHLVFVLTKPDDVLKIQLAMVVATVSGWRAAP